MMAPINTIQAVTQAPGVGAGVRPIPMQPMQQGMQIPQIRPGMGIIGQPGMQQGNMPPVMQQGAMQQNPNGVTNSLFQQPGMDQAKAAISRLLMNPNG